METPADIEFQYGEIYIAEGKTIDTGPILGRITTQKAGWYLLMPNHVAYLGKDGDSKAIVEPGRVTCRSCGMSWSEADRGPKGFAMGMEERFQAYVEHMCKPLPDVDPKHGNEFD